VGNQTFLLSAKTMILHFRLSCGTCNLRNLCVENKITSLEETGGLKARLEEIGKG